MKALSSITCRVAETTPSRWPTAFKALAATASLIGCCAAAGEPLKTIVNPVHLSNTTQYGYSQATVAAGRSKLIFVSGQVGISEQGPNDFNSQVDRSFARLLAALAAAGGKADDVVKITLLILDHDPEKLKYVVEKRRAVFGSTPPASTLIPVTALYAKGVAFEIDAVAVAPP